MGEHVLVKVKVVNAYDGNVFWNSDATFPQGIHQSDGGHVVDRANCGWSLLSGHGGNFTANLVTKGLDDKIANISRLGVQGYFTCDNTNPGDGMKDFYPLSDEERK